MQYRKKGKAEKKEISIIVFLVVPSFREILNFDNKKAPPKGAFLRSKGTVLLL
jgi:hypothetical protein